MCFKFVSTVHCLLIYASGSKSYMSSGPILKAIDGNYLVVGLHCGGIDQDTNNRGTKFSNILQNIAGKNYSTSK